VKAARWAPISGVIWVVLWIVVLFLISDDAGESDSEIRSWFADSGNRDKQVAAFFVMLAASLFFVWFVAVLRSRLAAAQGKAGPPTAVAFGAGLVATALWIVASVFFMGISFAASDSDEFVTDPNTYRVINGMGYAIWFSASIVAALLVFATAFVSLRGALLPKWLAWLSVVVAVGMLASFVFVPFLVFLGWVLVVSVVLIWKPAGGTASAATG
jgi:hypothetical protein